MTRWLAVPVMALWGFISPAAQGLMTRHVTAGEQGQLQGASSSLMALSSLFGPVLFTQSFSWGIAGAALLPGAPYLVAAGLLAAAAAIAAAATRLHKS